MSTPVPEPIRTSVTVALSQSDAYALFAERFDSWWPSEYTWAQDTLQRIGLEPRVGGRCYELGPHEFHSDWGRVLAWEPPHRLRLAWQISPRREPEPNPAKASEVEIRFEPAELGGTRVLLEHRGFERHGPEGTLYRGALASARGWSWILERYAAAAG
jgi:uncharacterized protein YndB with AHSA1/START domain